VATSWSRIAQRFALAFVTSLATTAAYAQVFTGDADFHPAGIKAVAARRPSSSRELNLVDLTDPNEAAVDAAVSEADKLFGADYFDTALVARNGKLFGLIAPSDPCFNKFVSPQSNPLLFDDPRTLTEVRTHFVNQWIPNDNPVFAGGSAQFLAAQIRVAVTERLSIIATKDGYFWLHPENGALGEPQGFANLAGGLKYNILRFPETQSLVSVGFTHEFPSGSNEVFQGTGDGEWNLFYSAGQELFGLAHLVSGGGIRIPNDGRHSGMMWSSQAVDVMLTDRVYLLSQLNWFHWYENGGVLPLGFEGNDLFNLGSNAVEGNDIVTTSIGGRYKFGRNHETGVAYELPLTQRKDLLEGRLYVDLILRY
jgi:hypothetical protein